MFKKQKQLLDKGILDYLRKEKYKDTFNKAIVEYEKPYSDIEGVNKNIETKIDNGVIERNSDFDDLIKLI